MLTNYAILLGSNVVVIMLLFLPNYASFLHQNYFSDLPKDMYCKSQNMNNQKHWYFPYLLQINISASRPPQQKWVILTRSTTTSTPSLNCLE